MEGPLVVVRGGDGGGRACGCIGCDGAQGELAAGINADDGGARRDAGALNEHAHAERGSGRAGDHCAAGGDNPGHIDGRRRCGEVARLHIELNVASRAGGVERASCGEHRTREAGGAAVEFRCGSRGGEGKR